MKKLFVALTVPLTMAWSSICVSETCYTVEGVVKTENRGPISQEGDIELTLIDAYGDVAFQGSSPLYGTIYESCGINCVKLTHSAPEFDDDDESSFTTINDIAQIIGIIGLDDNGIPCSFTINESITEITSGTGFFENVTKVHINAPGYSSNCLLSGDNENEFDPISGQLCVE